MSTQEKIQYLISIGIPVKILAKYCNYNESHISKYARGLINVSNKCLILMEQGINQLIKDIEVVKDE